MIRPAALFLPLALLALPADAQTKSQRDQIAAARPAGPPVDCVRIQQIRETRVRSDDIVDFYMLGGKVYRNTLPHGCPRLGFERTFSYRTSITQLCSVDIITVIDTTSAPDLTRGPSCGLGVFQPVTGLHR